jgi:hypothetical protein
MINLGGRERDIPTDADPAGDGLSQAIAQVVVTVM